jgi:hypothetical protein
MMYLIILLYVFGAFVIHMNYLREGKIIVADILMFLTSPFSMLSVLLIKVVSFFVDTDTVIYQKRY